VPDQEGVLGVNIGKFRFAGGDIRDDIREKYGYDGDLLDIFIQNEGAVVHKWHHYIPIYDRYFGPLRNRDIRFLEIGVSKGGSLQMWRKYFGNAATIYGIDIDPDCARFDGAAGQVRIGSQDDPAFLRSVVDEMGGIDVVLDDGSHHMAHIRTSLRALFPLLAEGGTYMIEDLHTAYAPAYGGGTDRAGNFFGDIRALVDDMHVWYHRRGPIKNEVAGMVTGIHVHDSIVVLDKGQVHRPVHSRVGK
jgi:hypothetical protein